MRKRKREVEAVAAAVPSNKDAEIEARGKTLSGDAWGGTHEKEHRRQVYQRKLRLVESALQGCVPMTPALQAAADCLQRIRDAARRRREDAEATNTMKLSRPQYTLRNMRIFSDIVPAETMVQQMLKWHFRFVRDEFQAPLILPSRELNDKFNNCPPCSVM